MAKKKKPIIPSGPCGTCTGPAPEDKLWCSIECQDFWVKHAAKGLSNQEITDLWWSQHPEDVSCVECINNDVCEGFDFCKWAIQIRGKNGRVNKITGCKQVSKRAASAKGSKKAHRR